MLRPWHVCLIVQKAHERLCRRLPKESRSPIRQRVVARFDSLPRARARGSHSLTASTMNFVQFTLMPAVLTTLPHFSVSAIMYFPNSEGVISIGSAPKGSDSERVAPVTASARSLPDLMYPIDCKIGVNDACTSPLSRSGR
jgi:hypothetical protein